MTSESGYYNGQVAQDREINPSGSGSEERERNARAIWSVVAESTDPAARALWAEFGFVASLELAYNSDLEGIAHALSQAASNPAFRDIAVIAAHERQASMSGANLRAVAAAATGRWRERMDSGAEDIVARSADRGVRPVIPGDSEWPDGLDDLHINAPAVMWAKGASVLSEPIAAGRSLAFVGSRAASDYGLGVASDFAAIAAERGATIVSGGAYGIDAAAHRGALTTGRTVAVLAGGLDSWYPKGNSRLLESIASQGIVVSESPIGTTPSRWRFLARNRLIAAIAGATVVIEAAWRSGALSTASHADALSRPVGAVPGSVLSSASGGCHRLVRERGASLVTTADDALELLREFSGCLTPENTAAGMFDDADLLGSADRLIYDGIPPRSSITASALARECATSIDDVERALRRIEVLGLVERRGSNIKRSA